MEKNKPQSTQRLNIIKTLKSVIILCALQFNMLDYSNHVLKK